MSRSKLIFLSSEFGSQLSNSPSDIIYSLNMMGNSRNVMLSVQSFSCANLVYPINSKNNKIYFKEAGGSTLTATISEGNYDGSTILTAIKNAMDIVGDSTYTITLNSITKKLTISATGNVQLVDGSSNAYKELGYEIPTSNSTSITASYPINLAGSQFIDIQTDISHNNYSSGGKSNILFRVPITVGFGNILYYENNESDYMKIDSDDLRSIEFRLLDDKGALWELPKFAVVSIVLKVTPLD